MPPQAAEDFYTLLQRLQVVAVASGRRAWSRMGPDFDPSWQRIAPQLVQVTAAAQLAAATAAAQYVPAVLDEQEIPSAAEARIRPAAFAGVAWDGRPLDTLLEGAVRAAKIGARGADGGDALAMGQRWLDMALQTVITDAARDMTAAEIAVRPQVTSWVRMLNPPSCSRCAVLAGVVYEWNKPNPRHPRCDCFTLPTTVAKGTPLLTDAGELYRRGLITDLSKAQRQQIDGGANLTRVLNQSRDHWRERMAVERAAAKAAREAEGKRQTWGSGTPTPLPAGGIQDFISHLTRDVAIRQLKERGVAN